MIKSVFSVYDTKGEIYLNPFLMSTKGEALRGFSDLVNDPSTMFAKHPEDYVLFQLGTFDDSIGSYVSFNAPTSLGVAIEFVKAV